MKIYCFNNPFRQNTLNMVIDPSECHISIMYTEILVPSTSHQSDEEGAPTEWALRLLKCSSQGYAEITCTTYKSQEKGKLTFCQHVTMQLLIWSSLTYISYKQNFPKQAKYISIYQLDEKPFPHLYIENFQMIGQEYMLYHIMANCYCRKKMSFNLDPIGLWSD